MSNEKFTVYTRANDWRTAAGNIYHFSNWRSLEGMRRSDNEPQDGAEYRVTVERIEPEPEKRYSVWRTAEEALSSGAYYGDRDDAKKEWLVAYPDFNYRIWDHSTNPPTDVTDADPEAEVILWWCTWTPRSFDAEPSYASGTGGYFEWGSEGRATMANAAITSATEPTFAEFAAAVKDATGVEIPVPEEPMWWWWDGEEWLVAIGTGVQVQPSRRGECVIWATTADRDAKRDRLLAAAKEAGKP